MPGAGYLARAVGDGRDDVAAVAPASLVGSGRSFVCWLLGRQTSFDLSFSLPMLLRTCFDVPRIDICKNLSR